MKHIAMWVIRLYWHFTPISARNYCIFNKSCSHHVYDKLRYEGLIAGLLAFYKRYHQCRSGYKYINENYVKLADKTIVNKSILRV